MSLFSGGGKKVKPQFTGLAVQTSSTTVPITLAYGKSRVSPNIIGQWDFEAHKQKQKAGKGLGGSQTTYTYSASFLLALCYGVSTGITRVWKDQSKETDYTALGFSFFPGNTPQTPWGYLTTNHPSDALGYPDVVLMAVANYDLGQSNTFGQHSFEGEWALYNTQVDGTGDADPALVIDDFLNNPLHGALGGGTIDIQNLMSTGAATTTGDSAFQTYCRAMGFGFSPTLDSQEDASAVIERWTKIFNTAIIWTGYSVKLLPYGSEEITGHGVTYIPDMTVRYTLTDADFIYEEGEDPIRMRRKAPADAKNSLKLEIKNRNNEYNPEPVEYRDQGLVDQYGLKPATGETAHEITEPAIGQICVALMGQRAGYIRNEWEFKLPPSFMLLQPGDIVECVDPLWGTWSVMIIDIEEDDNDQLSVVVEDYFGSTTHSGTTEAPPISNNPINTGETASDVNTPVILQPPPTLTDGQPQIWAAVSGGDDVTADPHWGGCEVWISTDGGTAYNMVGQIDAPARMGTLVAALAAYGGANPDTVNTLKVDSAISAAEFSDATVADAAAGVTIFYIAPEGANDEEFASYTDATLNAPDEYWFDDLYRGLHGSTPGAHGIGAQFARLDAEAVFKYNFPLELVGETIWVKFVSYNIWGSGYQDIASVTPYSFVISGAYTYGVGVDDLNDVDVSGVGTGGTVDWVYDGSGGYTVVPAKFGFGFSQGDPVIDKPIAYADVGVAWSMPAGLAGSQGTIGDSLTSTATAPDAQTDFDIQSPPGTSIGTMRFAASSLTATFIKASTTAIPAGQPVVIVAPSDLNNMHGKIFGSILGTRT